MKRECCPNVTANLHELADLTTLELHSDALSTLNADEVIRTDDDNKNRLVLSLR